MREPHSDAGHFIHLLEPAVRAPCRKRADLKGLLLEEIACGIDAIDPDIIERAAAHFLLKADIILVFDLQREDGIEQAGLAQLPGLHQLDRLHVRFFKMEPIGDHELDAVSVSRFNHFFAFPFRDRHGFLT